MAKPGNKDLLSYPLEEHNFDTEWKTGMPQFIRTCKIKTPTKGFDMFCFFWVCYWHQLVLFWSAISPDSHLLTTLQARLIVPELTMEMLKNKIHITFYANTAIGLLHWIVLSPSAPRLSLKYNNHCLCPCLFSGEVIKLTRLWASVVHKDVLKGWLCGQINKQLLPSHMHVILSSS